MTATQRAGAYRTAKNILIHPVALTDTGIAVHIPPVFRLDLAASAADVGASLRTALKHQHPPIPHPARDGWKAVTQPFLDAIGAQSWRAFESAAVHCWVAAAEGTIRFTPLANGGPRGPRKGFQPFGAREVTASEDGTDAEIGEALLEALAACR